MSVLPQTDRKLLLTAMDRFAVAMKSRVMQKYDEGWDGWDDPHWQRNMAGRMDAKAQRIVIDADKLGTDHAKDLIDIANFAAFLWWQAARKEAPNADR